MFLLHYENMVLLKLFTERCFRELKMVLYGIAATLSFWKPSYCSSDEPIPVSHGAAIHGNAVNTVI